MATNFPLSNRKPSLMACAIALTAACGGATAHSQHDQEVTGTANPESPSTAANPSKPAITGGIAAPVGTIAEQGSSTPSAPQLTQRAYAGTGFVVHEWGTNTVVVGSDGSLQRGLHHEGDDLPDFVYDRVKQANLLSIPSVDKMETPVDYFYSDKALEAKVSVGLPDGVLTQWYPAVDSFAPAVLMGQTPDLIDPIFALHYPYVTPACSSKYGAVAGGKLDWGKVEVLAPDANVDADLPDAPLDRFTWSYARQVKANAVRVSNPSKRGSDQFVVRGPQAERFLFYRGLGNFPSPALVTAANSANGSTVRIATMSQELTGPVFVLNVGTDRAAFHLNAQGLAGTSALNDGIPELAKGKPIDDFVTDLSAAMTEALVGTGLYTDEALGMVNTWRRQWFRTPGVRVLYFAPQAWIDAQVPLTIDPRPSNVVRVMVMRVEVLTPSVEADDKAFAAMLGQSDADFAAGSAHFTELGRFAEPRLRRALTSLGTMPARAEQLLTQIESPNASFAVGQ
jgi:hypothetical protein